MQMRKPRPGKVNVFKVTEPLRSKVKIHTEGGVYRAHTLRRYFLRTQVTPFSFCPSGLGAVEDTPKLHNRVSIILPSKNPVITQRQACKNW